jgi:hypothetical protein
MADLATLQTRLDVLEDAFAKGIMTVEYDGRRVTYFNPEQLLVAIGRLKADIAGLSGTRVTTIVFEQADKGN